MSYEKNKADLDEAAKKIDGFLWGKRVVSVEMPVGYPGHYTSLTLVFDDGTKLEVRSGGGGCSECDPEGIGWGVDVGMARGAK